jgi:hypothetical protein
MNPIDSARLKTMPAWAKLRALWKGQWIKAGDNETVQPLVEAGLLSSDAAACVARLLGDHLQYIGTIQATCYKTTFLGSIRRWKHEWVVGRLERRLALVERLVRQGGGPEALEKAREGIRDDLEFVVNGPGIEEASEFIELLVADTETKEQPK